MKTSRTDRTQILNSLRAKSAPGRAIVGAGAGTGLSANCEESGGVELIVIYNSGRYRLASQTLHDPAADAALFPRS